MTKKTITCRELIPDKMTLSTFSGTWEMSEKEAESIMDSLRKKWLRWKIKSA